MTALFTLTIFLSALLMFLVQPMISKTVLPFLGGSPSVWNTAMVFFQFMLLLGYLYAHLSQRLLGAKRQALLHIVLIATSLICLPLALQTADTIEPLASPIGWLLMTLFLTVGIPFFLLSANAPMLQNWFAHTKHPSAHNPYFLYSASNAGSFIALLGYPFFVEPGWILPDQMELWSGGFVLLLITLVGCMLTMRRYYTPIDSSRRQEGSGAVIVTFKTRLLWLALTIVPSSLLLGVTNHITTDVASLPLLWVIPLALYLLSFVLVFHPRQPLYKTALRLQILAVPVLILMLIREGAANTMLLFIVHLGTFFILTMVCHGRLAQLKPSTSHLTEFYLWMSLGGVLGGMFNALLAPQLFIDVFEYPLMICLACFLRPNLDPRGFSMKLLRHDLTIPLSFLVLFGAAVMYVTDPANLESLKNAGDNAEILRYITRSLIIGYLLALLGSAILFRKRPLRFGLIVSVFMALPFAMKGSGETLFMTRNFFGVSKVILEEERNTHEYLHGTTLHGMQSLDPALRLSPLAYYGPVTRLHATLPEWIHTQPIGIVGLGAGTLACLGMEKQPVTFYEIDQAVLDIAANPAYFSYLELCPAKTDVIIGDGRIELSKVADEHYGMIVIDAYTSDSLPMHLLTKEAVALYFSKLQEKGILVFNVSNRYMDLRHVFGNIGAELNVPTFHIADIPDEEDELRMPSRWIAMTTNPDMIALLTKEDAAWEKIETTQERVWTDNYTAITRLLMEQK